MAYALISFLKLNGMTVRFEIMTLHTSLAKDFISSRISPRNSEVTHFSELLFLSGESKLQPLNGSGPKVRKSAKRTAKNGQKQTAQKGENEQKCKHGRTQAKKCENDRYFLLIVPFAMSIAIAI